MPGATLRTLAGSEPERCARVPRQRGGRPAHALQHAGREPAASLVRDSQGEARAARASQIGPGGFIDNLDAWLRREATARDAAKPPAVHGRLVRVPVLRARAGSRTHPAPAGRRTLPYSAFALRVEHLAVHDHARATPCTRSPRRRRARRMRARSHELESGRAAAAGRVRRRTRASIAGRRKSPELFLERVRRAQGTHRRRRHLPGESVATLAPAAARRQRPAGSCTRHCVARTPRRSPRSVQFARHRASSRRRRSGCCEVQGRRISTRPIAGTRPRTGDPDQDRRDTAELDRASQGTRRTHHAHRPRAQRLGRVCEAGSVRVDEYMVTETYAHVHHIVSNVRGTLRASATPVDALRAVFPGGTITGCPKVRCMQIIAELEGEGRGAYTGLAGLARHRRRRGLQHPDPHADDARRSTSSCAPAPASSRTRSRSASSRRPAPRRAACCARSSPHERARSAPGSMESPARRCRPMTADCSTAMDCSKPCWCARASRGFSKRICAAADARPRHGSASCSTHRAAARGHRACGRAGAVARDPQGHRHARQLSATRLRAGRPRAGRAHRVALGRRLHSIRRWRRAWLLASRGCACRRVAARRPQASQPAGERAGGGREHRHAVFRLAAARHRRPRGLAAPRAMCSS